MGWSIVSTVFLFHWSAWAGTTARPIARAAPLSATTTARDLCKRFDCGFIEYPPRKNVGTICGTRPCLKHLICQKNKLFDMRQIWTAVTWGAWNMRDRGSLFSGLFATK